MLGLSLGASLNPCILTLLFTHLRGERIRFVLVRLEAPRQEYLGLE